MKEMNILILGQTGVGKSTWINAIVNYMTYSSLEEAERNQLVSVIPTSFSVSDNDYNTRTITVGKDINENTEAVGRSATQAPKTYKFELKNTLVRLIDTPSIGDTHGIEVDKKHVDLILNHISYFDELHGICILLKANDTRMDAMFQFCIKELLKNLHKDASKNVVFCFTNARNTHYMPGETLPVLRELLKDIEVTIETKKSTLYCVDNEAFRFLCAVHYGINYQREVHKTFSTSWEKSVVEIDRMLEHIASLPPHLIRNTTSLNHARYIIERLKIPIADISSNIQKNIALGKDRMQEIQNSTQSEAELVKRLYIPQLILKVVPLGYPRTVCTDSSCVSYVKKGKITETEYITHCHKHCYLGEVTPETISNSSLWWGRAINPFGNCYTCNHSYKLHMHITYEQKQEYEQVIDESVKSKIDINKSDRQRIQDHILDLQNRIKKLEEEQKIIVEVSVQFACFLNANAIVPYNDVLKDYLDYLIRLEKEKKDKTEVDWQSLRGLEEAKLKYERDVASFEQSMKSMQNWKILTPNDIQNLVQQLYSLPIYGEQLRQNITVAIETNSQMMHYKDVHFKSQTPKSSEHKEKSGVLKWFRYNSLTEPYEKWLKNLTF